VEYIPAGRGIIESWRIALVHLLAAAEAVLLVQYTAVNVGTILKSWRAAIGHHQYQLTAAKRLLLARPGR
jgi:hypothetical protein